MTFFASDQFWLKVYFVWYEDSYFATIGMECLSQPFAFSQRVFYI
jgi:hypothetical protein